MDPILLASVVAIIISVIIVVIFFRKPQEGNQSPLKSSISSFGVTSVKPYVNFTESLPDVQQQPRPPERQRNVPRRIQGNRNVRQRNRGIGKLKTIYKLKKLNFHLCLMNRYQSIYVFKIK